MFSDETPSLNTVTVLIPSSAAELRHTHTSKHVDEVAVLDAEGEGAVAALG